MTSVAVALTGAVDIAELSRVYRDVHASDLGLVDHSDPTVEQRLAWTAEAPGFAATVAHVEGALAGAVLGCPLPPETFWWRDLGAADPAVTREWDGRTFAICEAFVLPEHRRQRLGVPLILDLLASRSEQRVTMAVAEANTRVWRALQALGFDHVGDLVPFPGWRPHRMLVCPLPLRNRR